MEECTTTQAQASMVQASTAQASTVHQWALEEAIIIPTWDPQVMDSTDIDKTLKWPNDLIS